MSFIIRIFIGGLVLAILTLRFLKKYICIALPWIMAAGGALIFGVYALGQQFFYGRDAKFFLEQRLPPRETPRETFLLAMIELMLILRKKF